jgi:hypothetical protein
MNSPGKINFQLLKNCTRLSNESITGKKMVRKLISRYVNFMHKIKYSYPLAPIERLKKALRK